MLALIELVLCVLIIAWACGGSSGSKKSTKHYGGGYTYNHTPPPVDDSLPTQKFEGGYNGELNKEFENK